MIPRATYRLQFHKDFTFADAARLAPYLADLGVSHVYASPITTARAGSTHGYDVIDPTRVNPELGGEVEFRGLVAELRARGLGVILDIVPNHMAVGGSDNSWWLDVLEKGDDSDHAGFFDIDWDPPDPILKCKVLAPFLGTPYAEALASGDIALDFEPDAGRLSVTAYGQHRFPIRPQDYPALLREAGGPLSALAQHFEYGAFDEARQKLAGTERAAFARLFSRYDGRDATGRERLHQLLERQNFRLAWWRVAGDEINWRRFFNITELAGVRIERDEVFDTVHQLVLRLYADGLIDGVRVDHVDGLADPAGYCRKLRGRLEEAVAMRPADVPDGPAYLIVEKILASEERLPPDWRVDGTTGYEYMNEASALLHSPEGEAPLTDWWTEVSGRSGRFADEERAARIEILTRDFAGQLEATVRAFHRVARSCLETRDVTADALRRSLVALLSVFPAYRTYGTGDSAPVSDAPLLDHAVAEAKPLAAPGEDMVIDRLSLWLVGHGPGDPHARAEAVRRFQQLSAPVSAKAVEDTAFYRYGRLLSRNDVGFDPNRLSASPEQFLRASAERADTFPHSLLATATHDHKRGEDVRARLAVLSELPQRWIEHVRRWSTLNRSLGSSIDPADEYQLYQTLVGAWPLELRPDDAAGLEDFAERVSLWQWKALREAKLRSSWTAPATGYEQVCEQFARRCLDPRESGNFLRDLTRFVDEIAPAAALNGLAQTLLRCTVPGVPDLYQGTELWDLSLVDPDNRRPVDFESRQKALEQGLAPSALLSDWQDGRIKQAVIARALRLRAELPALFAHATFKPLQVRGSQAGKVLAFVRRSGGSAILVAVALRCAEAVAGTGSPLPKPEWWNDTDFLLPRDLTNSRWYDVLDGAPSVTPVLRVAELFTRLPVSLIRLGGESPERVSAM